MPSGTRIYHAKAIQDLEGLRLFLESKSEESETLLPVPTNSPAGKTETFIPNRTVEEYFQEPYQNYPRLQGILRAVFAPSPDTAVPSVPARDVAEKCSRVFCILICIDKAQYIGRFVETPELWDERLPFHPQEHPPTYFPKDPSDALFYSKFVSEQYRFCAERILDHSSRTIDEKRILPIVRRTQIGKGGHSTVNRVEISPTHDEIPNTFNTTPHVYAIKTFKGNRRSESNYQKELEAFRFVTEAGSKHTRGLIRFYGGFIYRGTFNIVLEYAGGGNLEQFFRQNVQPATAWDRINLWSAFFEVIKGLYTLHEKSVQDRPAVGNGSGLLVRGWHQDLKPVNILLVANPADQPYAHTFKVADLGLCHFKTIMADASEPVEPDTFGTRTYGAPECYRRTNYTEFRENRISQKVDIWSLGCIMCEMAMWLVKGWAGLERFRSARKAATDTLHRFRGGDSFHDGQKLLDVVSDEIKSLRMSIWSQDWITGRVLDLLPEVFHADPARRPTAEQLEFKSEDIVETAKDMLTQQHPRTPPNPRVPSRQSVESDRTHQPHSPLSSSPHSPWRLGPLVESPHHSRDNTLATPERPIRGSQVSLQSPTHGHPHRVMSARGLENGMNVTQGNWLPLAAPASGNGAPEIVQHTQYSPQSPGERYSQPVFAEPTPLTDLPSIPHLSRTEVLDWYTRRKYRSMIGRAPRLKHQDLLDKSLKDRDHVLMIDDSKTMRARWKDVTELARMIAYITKSADPDDLELYFLSESKRHKCSSSSAVGEKMRDHQCMEDTSLDGVFDRDLRQFAQTMSETQAYNRTHGRRKPYPPPRSIYVLTDGKLAFGEQNQGRSAIAVLAQSLAEARMSREQFGIQFIRFGTDERGQRLLEGLDELADKSLAALDLVDTEPADGNVVKMLIGAIKPLFDHQNERAHGSASAQMSGNGAHS